MNCATDQVCVLVNIDRNGIGSNTVDGDNHGRQTGFHTGWYLKRRQHWTRRLNAVAQTAGSVAGVGGDAECVRENRGAEDGGAA